MRVKVLFKRTEEHSLPLPQYATCGSAGFDFRANLPSGDMIIPAHGQVLIPTGFAVEIPDGHVGMLCARSGLSAKNMLSLTNGVGIIDSDYTGEIKIIIINHSDEAFTVTHGMRIAQMLIIPYSCAQISEVEVLSETDRGSGGFGSTGIK